MLIQVAALGMAVELVEPRMDICIYGIISICMSIYIYICMYIYMYIYMYTFISLSLYIYVWVEVLGVRVYVCAAPCLTKHVEEKEPSTQPQTLQGARELLGECGLQ